MTESASTAQFHLPGPGSWELDTTHFTRPMSRFAIDPLMEGFAAGFAEGTARYGLLLSHFKPACVNGFVYLQAVPFGAPEGAKGPPPKLVFQAITRVVPAVRRRIRQSRRVFETRAWRDDLRRWDEQVKPASIAKHTALQGVDLTRLSDEAVAGHVLACRDHMAAMIRQHHQFTITCSLPVGDLLAHASEWTGKTPGEILQLLRGSSRISLGFGADELGALGEALRGDEGAQALLDGPDAGGALERLRGAGGRVGEAARAYLDAVGYRCLGYDVADPYGLEMPGVLVRAIRAAVAGGAARRDEGAERRVAELRAQVPERHRGAFDELLAEARAINRLRDERGHYSDGWAVGLARRALLVAGERLVGRGLLARRELAVEASAEEVASLLRSGRGPTSGELSRRHEARTKAKITEAPPWLGAPPSPPPPADWLPEEGRRAARAIEAFISTLFGEPPPATTARSVKGLPVSPGVYEGRARLVGEGDFGSVEQGDVLVARSTSPYFNVILPLLGAIVTDRGGQLCHAAIVAREYGIPGVVGTRDATAAIKDGDRVRVDGDTGVVEVLG